MFTVSIGNTTKYAKIVVLKLVYTNNASVDCRGTRKNQPKGLWCMAKITKNQLKIMTLMNVNSDNMFFKKEMSVGDIRQLYYGGNTGSPRRNSVVGAMLSKLSRMGLLHAAVSNGVAVYYLSERALTYVDCQILEV